MVGMVAAKEVGVAAAEGPPVGVGAEAEDAERLAVGLAQLAAVEPGAFGGGPAEAGADRVEGVVEIGPSAIGIVGGLDLVAAHPLEIIVAGVELADMVEAQPAPVAGAVEARAASRRRPELARALAARVRADSAGFRPAVEFRLPVARARHALTFLSKRTI